VASIIRESTNAMAVSNPRYPHWCRIVRKTTDDPLEDEEDFSPLETVSAGDEDYDPLASDISDGEDSQQSGSSDDETHTQDNPDGDSQTTVVYEGICRSYKINTTSDKGKVITSERGLSLPLNQDEWDKLGVVPMEGDEIVVVHGTTHKEYGRVIDKNIANASFAGTHLTWRYGRN